MQKRPNITKHQLLNASWISAMFCMAAQAIDYSPLRAQVDPETMAAMRRDLNLSSEQVILRLNNEDRAAKLNKQLGLGLSSSYGGAWLTDQGTRLHVAVTNNESAKIVTDFGAVPILVKMSEGDLKKIQKKIDAIASSTATHIVSTTVDVTKNIVVVEVEGNQKESVQKYLLSLGIERESFSVVDAVGPVELKMNVMGGSIYYVGGGSCSVGFAVTRGFLTAGHCGVAGISTSQPSGTVRASNFPGDDFAWVEVTPENTLIPYVNSYNGGSNQLITGSMDAPVGASICRSGYATHVQCGTILSRSVTQFFGNTWVSELISSDACSRGGDSGGSAYHGDQAQGTTTGGTTWCGEGQRSFFQPVNEPLQRYGISLVVPPPPPSIEDHAPFGWYDIAQPVAGGIWVAGWAMDQDTSPITNPILISPDPQPPVAGFATA